MNSALTHIEQATTTWLTARLYAHGCLTHGAVAGVERAAVSVSGVAHHAHLHLTYTADANAAECPTHLFLKINKAEFPWAHKEAEFYSKLVPMMEAAHPQRRWPLARCFDAAYNPENSASHLLLEDLSETHTAATPPLPPTDAHSAQVMDALAAFHAFWWEHPRLGKGVAEPRTLESVRELQRTGATNFAAWRDYVGDRVTAERQVLIGRIITQWPRRRVERLTRGQGVTLVHRDTHTANFLFPKTTADTVRITDWQSWRIDCATDDLALFMAAQWYPERRARLERPLLQRYLAQLETGGVTGYTWDDLWYDYRASILRLFSIFIGGWHPRRAPGLWWDRTERCLLAVEDLACMELLES
ncbi:MAG: phosphotransferase [Caldilineaceae bacterium]